MQRRAARRALAWLVVWPGVFASTTAVEAQYARLHFERPKIAIGSIMGSAENTLAGVTGVVRVSEDRFVIAEAMNARVGLFSGSGERLRVVATEGRGPGEVSHPFWMGPCGAHRFGVFDAHQNALLTFDSEGAWQDTRRLPEQAQFNETLHCSGNGALLMVFHQPTALPTLGTAVRVPAVLARIEPGGGVDTIVNLGARTYYFAREVNGFSVVPLAPVTLAAMGDGRIFVADNMTGRIQVLDATGATIRTWRPLFPERAVSSRDWNAAIERYVSTLPRRPTQDRFRRVLAEVTPPMNFPAIDVIAADGSDRLWIRSYDRFLSESADWFVFDEHGKAVAGVRMPRSLRIMQITEDAVLGVETDEDGVERVVVYEVSIPAPR